MHYLMCLFYPNGGDKSILLLEADTTGKSHAFIVCVSVFTKATGTFYGFFPEWKNFMALQTREKVI